MNLREFFKSLVTFELPREWKSAGSGSDDPPILDSTLGIPEIYPASKDLAFPTKKSSREKVWVDNVFRFWVSIITVVICHGLYYAGSIPALMPLWGLFLLYSAIEIAGTKILLKTNKKRRVDFFLCGMDIATISAAIYFTGGINSPLYFLFFIPFVIQAFHRDWALILFYGFGSVAGYTAAIFFAVNGVSASVNLPDLVARVVCMMITIVSAVSAVHLLRMQEKDNNIRLSRMRGLTKVSQILNGISATRDMRKAVEEIAALINAELKVEVNGWARILLKEDSDFAMRSVMDPESPMEGLKQEISVRSCPAATANSIFEVQDAEKESGCPTESFSFISHICVPVSGSDNESYGVIFAGAHQPGRFQSEEKGFLTFIARALGLTIQRLRRVEELQLSLEMDSCAMATYLASTRGLDETFKAVLDGLNAILKTEQSSLYLWNSKTRRLEPKCSVGPYAAQEKSLSFGMGEGIVGRVFEKSAPEWTANPDFAAKELKNHFPFENLICFPIQNIKGEPLGAVTSWHLTPEKRFSAYEIDISSTFITRATVAIENAFLHKKPNKEETDKEDERAA